MFSSLFAPAAGRLTALNPLLLEDPSHINVDGYGEGWLLEMESAEDLLSPEEYVALLGEVWDDTQRAIKGQMN